MYEKELFSAELQKEIKDRFYYVDCDPHIGAKRLFFENAGGSYRLKAAVEAGSDKDAYPDCPDRDHHSARWLNDILNRGMEDIRVIFNAKSGVIATDLTATQVMFNMVRTIVQNVEGTNMVTTALEHPSAFDAVNYYADKYGKELRVADTSNETGGVEAEDIVKLIDRDTVLLSVMHASNFSGAAMNIEKIVRMAREIKPELYIVVDGVQHAAHGIFDVEKAPVDGMNFGPYKFFGCRGIGVGYLSDRLANLPHHKVIRKPQNEWRLGSPVPMQMASISAVVDYVCWLGGQFAGADCNGSDCEAAAASRCGKSVDVGRRQLFVEGMKRISLHEKALLERMLDGTESVPGLRHISGVKVCPDCRDLTNRDLIVPVVFEGADHGEIVKEYERRGVILRETPMSSMFFDRILGSFGMDGALRVSPLHCHGAEDIDEYLKITKKIAESLR